MYNILIAGAGKIGSLIACLLSEVEDYKIILADKNINGICISKLLKHIPHLRVVEVNVFDEEAMIQTVNNFSVQVIVSSLPYYCNVVIARVARSCGLHYFDLTEDIEVTSEIEKIAEDATTAFVPQCGLAPGFINIAAHTLMCDFDNLDSVKLRVGGLPQHPCSPLHYGITWSIDGLINEYGNLCHAIRDGKQVTVLPLEGLESLFIDGTSYEAFNTSGGLGSLYKTYLGKVRELNYKTIRYPGHCEKISFLMRELKLNDDRDTLKCVLERAIPEIHQDVVIILVSVTGEKNAHFTEKTYLKKVYPQQVAGLKWSAIQLSTSAQICSLIDIVIKKSHRYRGFLFQEEFTLDDILQSRYGVYYA